MRIYKSSPSLPATTRGSSSKEKSNSRSSPTTVVEVGDSSSSETEETELNILPHHQIISPVDFSTLHDEYIQKETAERYARLRRKQQERKKFVNVLPTIYEVSAEQEKNGGDGTLGFTIDDISSHIRTLSLPSSSTKDEFNEVQLLTEAASLRAAHGNEKKSIEIYNDALHILAQGARVLSRQMELSASKDSKFEKTAQYIILHEEWTETAFIIANIRTMMANLYERQREYDEAIYCCEEARSIYQHQATFDKRHHKRGSGAVEKEMVMDEMIERIEEARESESVRQSLHDTVERIQEKLAATEDQTSRTFLYEDIFDKLSTILSLELMYLGETHPQTADTKALLSVFYVELKQNEKAIKVMNDAVLICEMALGDSHPRTGTKYHEAAKLFERIGGEENDLKAIDLYEKAIITLKNAEGDISEIMSSALNGVGALYIKRNKYDDAISKLKAAIRISEEHHRESPDDISTEPIQIWLNLAECYCQRSELNLSSDASRNALRIQRSKRKFYDGTGRGVKNIPKLMSNMAIVFTLKTLGKSLASESKFDQACGHYQDALSTLQGELSVAHESAKFNHNVDRSEHEDEVAGIMYELAKLKQEDNKLTEASKLYRESLQLRKESDKRRAVDKRSNHIHCALCLAGIGTIELLQNEAADAFKSFNQAIYYVKREGITDSHPITKMLWDKSRIAATQMEQGQAEGREINEDEIRRIEAKAEEFRKSKDFDFIDTVIGMERDLLNIAKGGKKEESEPIENEAALSPQTKSEAPQHSTASCISENPELMKSFELPAKDKLLRRLDKLKGKLKKTKGLGPTMAEF